MSQTKLHFGQTMAKTKTKLSVKVNTSSINGKKPRIRLELLQRHKNQTFAIFWNSNVQEITYWLHTPDAD